jgi:hypothetical protein
LIKEGRYAVKTAKRISDVALGNISFILRADFGFDHYTLTCILDDIGIEWTAKKGNWPKRFAKIMKRHGHTFDNDFLSRIGKIARESCITSNATELIVTPETHWHPGDYGDSGSCYWGCRSGAHLILKESKSFALLLHGEDDFKMARCWCTPWSNGGEEYFVIYNCYCRSGEPINLISYSRIVSDIFNIPYYRDVQLTCRGRIEGPLWINGGKGYILGSQKASDIEEVDLDYFIKCDECGSECTDTAELHDGIVTCGYCGEDTYHCSHCDTRLHDDEAWWPNDNADDCYCEECFRELFTRCRRCEAWEHNDDAVEVDGEYWCDYCASEYAVQCDKCGDTVSESDATYLEYEDIHLCENCFDAYGCECDHCHTPMLTKSAIKTHDDDYVCAPCSEDNYFTCDECGDLFELSERADVPGSDLCSACDTDEEEDRSKVA